MKHEMTQWKCFVQTHLLFVTIYGLMGSSSVTFKYKMTLVDSNVSLVTSLYLVVEYNKKYEHFLTLNNTASLRFVSKFRHSFGPFCIFKILNPHVRCKIYCPALKVPSIMKFHAFMMTIHCYIVLFCKPI